LSYVEPRVITVVGSAISSRDPIGRDVIIQWPGGVNMQLYWHTTAPNYPPLQTVPENRVYLSPDSADAFIRGFVAFAHGKIVSDNRSAPGVEIGRPTDTYRRVRIESAFGRVAVLVTDGHLPYPYGREVTGYEVADLSATVGKAESVFRWTGQRVSSISARDQRAPGTSSNISALSSCRPSRVPSYLQTRPKRIRGTAKSRMTWTNGSGVAAISSAKRGWSSRAAARRISSATSSPGIK
jgi:hypothetical protein